MHTTGVHPQPGAEGAGEASEKERQPEKIEAIGEPAARRIVLRGIRWETYERLLEDLASSGASRLTYDRGVLEIMSPLPTHERTNRLVATLVEAVTEEWGQEIDNLGSTTFRRQDMERGFEPDSCFYIQSVERIRNKIEIDLTVDPPPDLVIEIDIAHSCLPKLPIYARLGVPEVWRYNGSDLSVLILAGGAYEERSDSEALPGLSRDTLAAFLRDSRSLGRIAWLRRVRQWARRQRAPGDAPH